MEKGKITSPIHYRLVAIFVLVAVGFISLGALYYRYETELIKDAKYEDISAIAELKADSIQEWRGHRLADAQRVSIGPLVRREIARLLQDPTNHSTRAALQIQLKINRKGTVYADALFLDTKGNILLSDNPNPAPVDQATMKAIKVALKDRKEFLSDFFRDPKGIIYIDAVAPIPPIHDNSARPIAIVILRSKAADFLYPFIQSWPTPSETGETLIVCRDGDSILFLNELRHRSNTALSLRFPLTDTQLPGVQAVLGNYGRVIGRDYRGVDVLAVTRPVPKSSWSIVAKVDAEEILAEVQYRAWVVSIIVFLVLLISAGLIISIYRNRQEAERKQAEEQLRKSEEYFRAITENASDIILVVDKKGTITYASPSVDYVLGLKPEELIGKSSLDLIVPADFQRAMNDFGKAVLTEGVLVPNAFRVRHKDGSERVLEGVGKNLFKNPSVAGFVMNVRDVTVSRKAEEALKESEEKYRNIIKNAVEGIFQTNPQGRFIIANPAYVQMLGYESAEELINSITDIEKQLYVDPRKRTELIHLLTEHGFVSDFQLQLYRKDRSIIWISAAVRAVKDESGNILRLEGMVVDITESKRVEEALRESENKYRLLADNANDVIFVLDMNMNYTYVSPSVKILRGYEPAEVLKQPPIETVTPSSWDLAMRTLSEVMELEKFEHGEIPISRTLQLEMMRKDGTTVWTEVKFSFIRDEDQRPVGILGVTRDITERRQAEAQRLNLVTAIEQAAEGIYLTDANWIIQFANPAFEKMLGYDKGEMIGWHARLLKSGKHDRIYYQNIRETLASGKTWSGRGINKKKDGTFIDADVIMSPVRDGSGNIINYVCIHRDITYEMALESRLLQAQKMEAVGTLAGGIAHDFNNLLMAIQGYTSSMLLETDPDDPRYGKLKVIERQVETGANLTKQLLGFARVGKFDVKPLDMNRVLEKSSSMFGRTKKEIAIHRRFQEDLWAVEADTNQIDQVFMNLYVNAWQAMPGGGELYLETANMTLNETDVKHPYMEPGRYVKVSVTDTGLGMDEKTKERIFEPFFTTKEMGRGTGLGLAMVYGIVKGHKGFINVYSEEGKGTTFTIYLPATEKKAILEEKPSAEIFKGEETILLVDDEEEIVNSMKEIMRFLGYHFLTAGSGPEALRIYEENGDRIDLVILDMIMPGMGGGETFDRLKAINSDIKVILSSGYSVNGQASEIMVRGCRGFIQKPVNIADLSQKIREVLDEKT